MKYKCKNMNELRAALRKEISQAMSDAESELFLTGLENNSEFYSQGKPKVYKRTHQLGNALKTTGVQESGNHWEAEIYEDMAYDYAKQGMSTPAIFSAAEKGEAGILGKPEFWQATEDQAEPILHKHIKKHFKQK